MTPTALDRLALALVDAGPDGLTRTAINAVFLGHLSADELDALLARLEAAGAVRSVRVPTAGRWATRWAFVTPAPVVWTPGDVALFWRAWLAPFGAWLDTILPRPADLRQRIEHAGRRGVSLRCALEAVDRYMTNTPAPSIDAWRPLLEKAVPLALVDLADD